jgi:hypothetical protein
VREKGRGEERAIEGVNMIKVHCIYVYIYIMMKMGHESSGRVLASNGKV